MKKKFRTRIIRLMAIVFGTCNEILAFSNAELLHAEKREHPDEESLRDIRKEIATLEQIILIAKSISEDISVDSHGKCVAILLFVTSTNIRGMLHGVATKRSLQEKIVARFKEASDIMNTHP